MIALNVLLVISAGILLVGVVEETDKAKHKNITLAFCAVLLCTIALNLVDLIAR